MINFNAGPAALPDEVVQQASQAVLNYEGTGMSVLSIPHRGQHFTAILEESKQLVRELCGLGEEYEVLWLHGGGRMQFTMVPMNFLTPGTTAGYIDSGFWSEDAIRYAQYYGKVKVLASSKQQDYNRLPHWPDKIPADLAFVHFTTNNTIYGTQWKQVPVSPVPLIADMSSDIFSRRVDYKNCAMFYAVAQKNIGIAGATLAVVHKDMLKRINATIPPMLDYAQYVLKNSVLNTPPVFAIYVSLLTLRWIKKKGIDNIATENRQKAEALYNEVDRNTMFTTIVAKEDRSMMNVCFLPATGDAQTFADYCAARGILNVKGHRTVGGFRVSLYNAISLADVHKLVAVMQEFEKNNKQ